MKGIDTVWVNVSLKGMPKTLVGVVYISPHIQDITAFQEEMIEFLACKQQDGLEVVLMGDFMLISRKKAQVWTAEHHC